MAGPLDGIRVVDVTEGAQGPWAGALLGDLGADVIKIERPQGEMTRHSGAPKKNGIPLYHAGMNHGKRNIVLDAKTDSGHETMLQLIRRADIFLENWRRGVSARIGFDYETLSNMNPRLIYASASGFGEHGRYSQKAAVDNVSQAMGGYVSINGVRGGTPEKPRFIVIDFTSPLTIVQAILMALYTREETGRGSHIGTSQLSTMIAVGQVRANEYFMTDEVPEPWGSATPFIVPSQAFQTADKYIAVECPDQQSWRSLCVTLELPALADDDRFATNALRVEHRPELEPILKRAFVRFEGDRWIERLTAAGVPCSTFTWDIEDLYTDPQIVANDLLEIHTHPDIGWVRTNAVPWKLSETPAHYGVLSGEMDESHESVMAELAADEATR